MSADYTAAKANALAKAFALRTRSDMFNYSAFNPIRWDGKYGVYPIENEIASLVADALATKGYSQSYTCLAGLAVGEPVRISANNTVVLALATTAANAKVVGFVDHKGSLGATSDGAALTCYITHYLYKSGLSGLTAGNPVYLTDAGGYSATAGTVAKVVGIAISTTEAVLCADPTAALEPTTGMLSKTADYTVLVGDHGKIIKCDASGGAFEIVLPAPSTVPVNFEITVFKTSADTASATNAVTIEATAGGGGTITINGALTHRLHAQYSFEKVVSDGTNWLVTQCWDTIRAIDSTPSNMTDAQYDDVTSFSLTPGSWIMDGTLSINLNGATMDGSPNIAISENSANTTTDHIDGDNDIRFRETVTGFVTGCSIAGYRKTTTTTKTMYLKGRCFVSAGTPQHYGRMTAVRIA